MGLSNEERYAKIYCVIERLNDLADRAVGNGNCVCRLDPYDIKYGVAGRILKLIDQLWPTFLGRTRNSAHWFSGSESSGDTASVTGGVISTAFYLVDKSDLGKPDENTMEALEKGLPEEVREQHQWLNEYWPDSAVQLLDKNKPEEHFIWEAYCWCETYFYAANRYEDDMAQGLADTTAIICRIVGLCFKAFSDNSLYLRAWMAKTLLDKIVTYDENDLVTNWLREQAAHHDIRADYYDGDLYEDFRKYRPYYGHSLPLMVRMELAFRFLGRRFHYDHEHKQLLKMVEAAKKAGADVSIHRIKRMIARCKQLRAEYEKEEREHPYEAYCWITHDTVVHKCWEDDHPPKAKKAKKKAKKNVKRTAKRNRKTTRARR
jgi:hypothetical protein